MKSKLVRIFSAVAVVAMLAAALVSPVSAMSGVTLAVGNTTISVATPYLVTFTLGSTQSPSASAIVVTFATGMLVGNPAVTIQIGPGNGTPAMGQTPITADMTVAGQVATINTLNGSVPIGTIGAGAVVQLTFTNITNPASIGNFSVSVSTAAEPTTVASNVITTTPVSATGLPGVISVYNSAGTLITSSNDLAAALAAVQSQTLVGAVLKLTAGTYHSAYPANTTVACTIQGTDSNAANVILQSTGAWSLTGATITVDSVTIDASAGGLLTVGGASTTAATVTKSYLKGGVLTMSGAGTSSTTTVSSDTVTTAAGSTGLTVKTPTIVTGSIFNIDGTGTGINAQANVLVSNSTFTGTAGAGLGVTLNGGNASVIGTSTFTGLTTALTVSNTGAGVSFNGNTVTSCGVLSTHDAIVVTATSGTFLSNNSISKSLNNIINVSGNDNLVAVMLNSFSGNAKNAVDSAGGVLNCTRNYWGGSSSNPTSTANVSYASPLGAAPSVATFVTGPAGLTLTAATTVGVNITASTGMTTLGAAALAANPVSAALPSTVTLVKYFDVFGFGNASASATVDFYGTAAASVTSASTVYFYNSASGAWVAASNVTVSTANGFVEVAIAPGAGATPNTAPSPAQFEGTPFALVNGPSSSTTTTTASTTTTVATTTVATTATTPVVTTATTTAKTTSTTTAAKTTTTTRTTANTTTTHTPGKGKQTIPSGLLYAVIAVSVILVVVIVIVIIRASKD
jgi:hypothetical protein